LVEQADLHSAQTEALVRAYVQPLIDQGADTLVLGCTHYPFLRDAIQRVAGEGVSLIDPAEAVARELVRRLDVHSLALGPQPGQTLFFTTGDVAQVQRTIAQLWGEGVTVEALANA
jgi:glutamate racemase